MISDRQARWLWRIVKGTVAGGMIWLLLQQGGLDLHLLWTGSIHLPIVAVGLLLNLAMISLGAVRWQLLLGSQGIRLPFAWVHRMIYLTVCFNLLVPGSIGGDALRMGYITRQSAADRKGAALLTILADRLTGLYSLFVIAWLATLANLPALLDTLPTRMLVLSLTMAVLGGPLLLILLFWGIERLPRVRNRAAGTESSAPNWLDTALEQTTQAVRLFRQTKGKLAAAVCVSALAQTAEIVALLWIADGLGLLTTSADHFFVAAPVAWLANLLPISPGGLGVGEAAFAQVCQWLQPTATLTALGTPFLINRLLQMVASLPGLWVYLAYRHTED
ncbi:MAG: flippase-like domain-containing protein [Magnetococcales bacterium]|nr:flippase-like domain-containing protein [Magnetococcales bacterium]